MTPYLIAAVIALVLAAVGIAFWMGRRGGATAQSVTDLEANTDEQTAMLDAAATTPRDSAGVDSRLRDGSF